MASNNMRTKDVVSGLLGSSKKVACIANRDLELMDALKRQFEIQYGIECQTYLTEGQFPENFLETMIWNQDVALILPKFMTDHQRNPRIYTAIEASGVPTLNSVFSIRLCENRKLTFMYLQKNAPFIRVPNFYLNYRDAERSLKKGKKIVIKRNSHHVPHRFRCLGIASTPQDLKLITKQVPKDECFFQEYLGNCDNTVYKAYFIDNSAIGLKCTREDVFAERSRSDTQERFQLPVSLVEGFRQIGQLLKMNTYGLDYVIAPDGQAYVVDVNDFPSYRGVEEAINLLCGVIFERYFAI